MDTPCALCPRPVLDESNFLVWEIFAKHMQHQARVAGLGGFIGFDYGALPVLFDAYGVPQCERMILLDKLSVITRIAVRYWNEKDSSKDK
jgi:hypothetical protein